MDTRERDACLFVYVIDSLDEIEKLLLKNNQTLVSIGLRKEAKEYLSKTIILKGTNRIVNVGNALNMNIFWDGYDIVSFLSKLLSFS